MNRVRLALCFLSLSAFTACGGDDPAGVGNSIEGTLLGEAFTVRGAFYTHAVLQDQPTLVVYLVDYEGGCTPAPRPNPEGRYSAFMLAFFAFEDGARVPVTPGRSELGVAGTEVPATGPVHYFQALLARGEDPSGASQVPEEQSQAVVGTANLERLGHVAGERTQGSFEVEVGTQRDAVRGHFDATYCSGQAVSELGAGARL